MTVESIVNSLSMGRVGAPAAERGKGLVERWWDMKLGCDMKLER